MLLLLQHAATANDDANVNAANDVADADYTTDAPDAANVDVNADAHMLLLLLMLPC